MSTKETKLETAGVYVKPSSLHDKGSLTHSAALLSCKACRLRREPQLITSLFYPAIRESWNHTGSRQQPTLVGLAVRVHLIMHSDRATGRGCLCLFRHVHLDWGCCRRP